MNNWAASCWNRACILESILGLFHLRSWGGRNGKFREPPSHILFFRWPPSHIFINVFPFRFPQDLKFIHDSCLVPQGYRFDTLFSECFGNFLWCPIGDTCPVLAWYSSVMFLWQANNTVTLLYLYHMNTPHLVHSKKKLTHGPFSGSNGKIQFWLGECTKKSAHPPREKNGNMQWISCKIATRRRCCIAWVPLLFTVWQT